MKLHRAILNVLDAAGRTLSPAAIAPFVPQFLGSEPTDAQIAAALETLTELGHVTRLGDLDKGHVYAITNDGRARVR